jgi:hypothetical protein
MYAFQAPPIEVDMPMNLSNQYLNIPSEYWEDLVLPTSQTSPMSSLRVLEEKFSVPDSTASASTEISASISAQSPQIQVISKREEMRREQNRRAQRNFRARKEDLIKAKEGQLEVLQKEVAGLSCANRRLTESVQGMQQRVVELQRQNKVLRRLSVSNLALSEQTRRDLVSVLQDAAGGEGGKGTSF